MPPKKSKIEESYDSVDQLITGLQKLGDGIVLDQCDEKTVTDWFSTGIFSLDWILGKGIPRGKIIEVFGKESSGKSSLCYHAIGKCQKKGGTCALVDAEYSYDSDYGIKLGIDDSKLIKIMPDYGEQALDAILKMVSSNLIDVIVVDSVAALTPKVEYDGEMGDQQMGLQARMMSKATRKLMSAIGKTKTTVFFINQTRTKIGVVYGNPETTSGGNALKFYSSIRVEVKKKEALDGQKVNPTGIVQIVKAVKNKCAPPFRETEINLDYAKGYRAIDDIFGCAVNFGIIQRSGAWYNYDGERLGQGEKKSTAAIISNKSMLKNIVKEIKESFQNQ